MVVAGLGIGGTPGLALYPIDDEGLHPLVTTQSPLKELFRQDFRLSQNATVFRPLVFSSRRLVKQSSQDRGNGLFALSAGPSIPSNSRNGFRLSVTRPLAVWYWSGWK